MPLEVNITFRGANITKGRHYSLPCIILSTENETSFALPLCLYICFWRSMKDGVLFRATTSVDP